MAFFPVRRRLHGTLRFSGSDKAWHMGALKLIGTEISKAGLHPGYVTSRKPNRARDECM